ncbi:MFS transporter [Actinomadura xylanilytica]|uniref:MFS transporter n=1 Tax=Actinomadura xylanilytica TaxID=887459 RepID=UPI00255A7C47|nr:MFS transporter [Actinomadura xylanilytica]MDL4777028.1 MFS transporter [Actinomadura xylanilytica]
MTMTGAARRPAYRDALGEPRFRVLFATRTVAIMADTLRMLALSVLVYGRTGSPLLASAAFAAGFLPQVAGGTLAGALADRLRPRPLIAGAYALEAVAALALALLDLPIAAALALVALIACATPVFAGATNRLVAEVLTGDAYVLGRSLMTISAAIAQLLGLACGGIAVAVLGVRGALLAATAAYLAAALLVRLLLPDLPPAPPPASDGGAADGTDGADGGRRRSLVKESWAGTVRLLTDPVVRPLLLAQWLPSAFCAGAESLLVPYAAVRGFGSGTAALLLGCTVGGMLLGNLAAGRLLSPPARERLLVPLMALTGLPLVPLAFGVPAPAAAALLLLAGTGLAYELGIQRPFVDALPEDGRGHAFGLLSTGLMTLQGIGPLAVGALAEFVTVGPALAAAGVLILTVTALLRPALRRSVPAS